MFSPINLLKTKAMLKKISSVLVLFLLISPKINGQSFYKISNNSFLTNNFINSTYADICWGDYDNNGNLDFIFIENNFSPPKLFQNIGNDSFYLTVFSFPVLNGGSAKFGDFDNDGDLDLIISGNNPTGGGGQGPFTAIYKNTLPDSVNFIKISDSNFNFYQTDYSRCKFIDLDNDGDLDIYQTGYYYNNSSFISVNNINTEAGFTPVYNNLPIGIFEFGDFNNDGYIDVLINRNKYYKKNELGTNTYIQHIVNSSVSSTINNNFNNLVDFNNDGFLDIIQSGLYFDTSFSINSYLNLLSNLKTDSFNLLDSNDYSGIPSGNGIALSHIAYDFDNNGVIDILIKDSFGLSLIKNYNMNFSYINQIIPNNTSLLFTSVADYDNDKDLDLFLIGDWSFWPYNFATIFRNDSTPPNTPPTAPNVMWTEMDSTKIIFRWQPATDVETPQATLSYNLMVGTTPKGIDITSPMADTVTGFRRVVELGNAQLNNFYILDKSNFALGDTLYWSVQTIDNGFGYSPFSKGNSAIVHQNMTLENRTLCSNMDSISWKGQYFDSAGIYFKGNGVISNFDSAFFLQLDTAPAYLQSQTINLCAGSSYNWNGQNLMISGIYNKYYTTTQGCDSIERLVLTIQPNYTNVQTADLCLGDSVALGNQWLGSAGVYFDTLQTTFGCDSLVWLTIAVAPDDSMMVQTADSLVAQSSTAQIRWWDCDKQQFIYGVGGQVFVPQYNGYFAAELTQNGCTYRTRCFEVTNVGILSLSKGSPQINIRPNPSSGKVFINASETILSITLMDSYGKIITEIEELKTKEIELDISQFAPGIYTLKVETEVGVEMRKLVKE
jgi:hypothetical protein